MLAFRKENFKLLTTPDTLDGWISRKFGQTFSTLNLFVLTLAVFLGVSDKHPIMQLTVLKKNGTTYTESIN